MVVRSRWKQNENRENSIKTVNAPPGKLGITLANRTGSRGTVVSVVDPSGALSEQVSPGDWIIKIDGEDVSQMNKEEIFATIKDKAEFERELVLLA
jgi:C-terminal processing protease CtpA/Prc